MELKLEVPPSVGTTVLSVLLPPVPPAPTTTGIAAPTVTETAVFEETEPPAPPPLDQPDRDPVPPPPPPAPTTRMSTLSTPVGTVQSQVPTLEKVSTWYDVLPLV